MEAVRPVETPLTNASFHLPAGPGHGEMPSRREFPWTWSWWQLDDDDDIASADAVEAYYHWSEALAVGFGWGTPTGDVLADIEMVDELAEPVLFEGGRIMCPRTAPLDEDHKVFLATGGLLVVRVDRVPPPVVQLGLVSRPPRPPGPPSPPRGHRMVG